MIMQVMEKNVLEEAACAKGFTPDQIVHPSVNRCTQSATYPMMLSYLAELHVKRQKRRHKKGAICPFRTPKVQHFMATHRILCSRQSTNIKIY